MSVLIEVEGKGAIVFFVSELALAIHNIVVTKYKPVTLGTSQL